MDNDALQWAWLQLQQLDFPQAQGWQRLAVLPIEAVYFRLWAVEMSKLLGLPLWRSIALPLGQALGQVKKQVRAARGQSMSFKAGQCAATTGFLVKPVLRSGVQTVIVWRWNRVGIGRGQGGSQVHKTCTDLKLTWLRERVYGERAVLFPLDVQRLFVEDQDGYTVGVRAKACSEILVS